MFITELSIKRPAVSWVMSLILIIFGLFVFWKLPVRELPDGIQPPVVQVQVDYKSAAAVIVDACRPATAFTCRSVAMTPIVPLTPILAFVAVAHAPWPKAAAAGRRRSRWVSARDRECRKCGTEEHRGLYGPC